MKEGILKCEDYVKDEWFVEHNENGVAILLVVSDNSLSHMNYDGETVLFKVIFKEDKEIAIILN